MDSKYIEAKEMLKKYNQEHLLKFYNEISGEEQEKLLNNIINIDYNEINNIYETLTKEESDNITYTPINIIDKEKLTEEERIELTNLGKSIIKANQYAVVLLSGGQGTRLGYDGPKALFKLDFLNDTTILELQANKILEICKKTNSVITLYIMTNIDNNEIIQNFIEEKKYFGLGKNNIKLFLQDEIPLIDKDGKILMDSKSSIIKVPNGNGGIYTSLKNSWMEKDMRKRGIKYILTCNIDNLLAQLTDFLFIGFIEKKKAIAASKSVIKTNPHEKVGAFCLKNGKPGVVEYSDISNEMAEMVNENEELLYGDSFFGYGILNIDAINMFANSKMEYHKAIKKYDYVNEDGIIVKPNEPNAYKFEKFIFDAYSNAQDMPILRVKREEEFAPVKNAEGIDSPETAKELYLNYQAKIMHNRY